MNILTIQMHAKILDILSKVILQFTFKILVWKSKCD